MNVRKSNSERGNNQMTGKATENKNCNYKGTNEKKSETNKGRIKKQKEIQRYLERNVWKKEIIIRVKKKTLDLNFEVKRQK